MIGLEFFDKETGIYLFSYEFRPDILYNSEIRSGLLTAILNIMKETFGESGASSRRITYGKYSAMLAEGNFIYGVLFTYQTGPIYEQFLYDLVENCSFDCRIFKQIPNISEIMLQSNIAISSGGLTLWELSVLNIPTAIISYSEREKMTADYLDKKGWSYHMGQADELDPLQLSEKIGHFISSEELRRRTTTLKGQININGKKRIVNEFMKLLNA